MGTTDAFAGVASVYLLLTKRRYPRSRKHLSKKQDRTVAEENVRMTAVHERIAPHAVLEDIAIELVNGGVVCDGEASQQHRARAVRLWGERSTQTYHIGRVQRSTRHTL